METVEGIVESVHVGSAVGFAKAPCDRIQVEFDGIVGVVEVPGEIKAGDEVIVEIYKTPSWLVRDRFDS